MSPSFINPGQILPMLNPSLPPFPPARRRVQNLFHSVQLNVNNPHFLIMQGRITKVLNMKPPEILGLIEEAAGTKMYEGKKQAALRTLDKKQVKLEEINRVLTEDIMPALNKLRGEKAAYMEWQHASSSLERLRHFCVAHRYVEAERWAGRPLGGGVSAILSALQEGGGQESCRDVHLRGQAGWAHGSHPGALQPQTPTCSAHALSIPPRLHPTWQIPEAGPGRHRRPDHRHEGAGGQGGGPAAGTQGSRR